MACLRDFGFDLPNLTPELFEEPNRIIRMGTPPLRIEILMDIDGVDFDDCVTRAKTQVVEGISIPVTSLADLKLNKRSRNCTFTFPTLHRHPVNTVPGKELRILHHPYGAGLVESVGRKFGGVGQITESIC